MASDKKVQLDLSGCSELTSIGSSAFYYCTGLTELNFEYKLWQNYSGNEIDLTTFDINDFVSSGGKYLYTPLYKKDSL